MKAQNEKRHQETEPQRCSKGKTKEEGGLEDLCPYWARDRYLHWHRLESEAGSVGLLGCRGKDPYNFPILPGLGTKLMGREEEEERCYSRAELSHTCLAPVQSLVFKKQALGTLSVPKNAVRP